MASAIMLIAAIALLCFAAALLVWQRGMQRESRLSTERFIDSRAAARLAPQPAVGMSRAVAGKQPMQPTQPMQPRMPNAGVPHAMRPGGARPGASAASHAAPPPNAGWQAHWFHLKTRAGVALDHAMVRAGIADARVPALLALAATAAACLWAAHESGWPGALAVLGACGAVLAFWFSTRTRRRRQRIVRQLPAFLDGIVRLIVLGNSVPAAFQASLLTTEAPLRECLDHVSRMLRTGVEIDRALDQVASVYRARELELVGAVLRLSVKYGGRADVMLDRMASFMRDLEQAGRELSAMTAETRLSSWVLAALPIGIGGAVIVMNPEYFSVMWNDPTGRDFIYAAFVLQALGAYLLYRLARIKG